VVDQCSREDLMMQAVDVRAADADRERVIAELQRHTAAGRLSMDEFSERAAAVYGSRTMGELAALTADLPHDRRPAAMLPIPRGRLDLPGCRRNRGRTSRPRGGGPWRPDDERPGLRLVNPASQQIVYYVRT
jgi:hypothetical protein